MLKSRLETARMTWGCYLATLLPCWLTPQAAESVLTVVRGDGPQPQLRRPLGSVPTDVCIIPCIASHHYVHHCMHYTMHHAMHHPISLACAWVFPGATGQGGSSTSPCSDTYMGTSAFSGTAVLTYAAQRIVS